ncbi:MAG: tetratricopeptide repeat protein [Deltaproteobacteria bacterium]|nr:tetratricopeptide repeat protein [Deltaproteobacteria bacterium]
MINNDTKRSTSNKYINLSPVRKVHFCSVAAIFLLTLTIYANSLNNEFTNWDDPGLILENISIRSLSIENILNIFTPQAGQSYQPVRVLSYAIDYYFWQLDPVGYHLENILLHVLAAVILYLLLANVLNHIRGHNFRDSNRSFALFAALLFAAHPVNVEAVAWIAARKYVLLAVFYFLSFYLYVRSSVEAGHSILIYLLSVLTCILALLSSPFAVTLPGLLILYDYCRYRDIFPWQNIKKRLIYYTPYILLSLTQFIILVNVLSSGPDPTVKRHYLDNHFYTLLTMLRVLYDYIKNLLFPFWLNNRYVDYISLSFFEYKIIISFCVIIFIVLLLFLQIKKGEKLPLFCIGWFFITWFPVSNIIPISTTMADRYLYLPAVGLFFGFSLLVQKVSARFFGKSSTAVMITAVVLILSLSFLTIQRNKVWANSLSLWEDSLRKAPNSPIAHKNLADALDDQGRRDEAIDHYLEALRIKPDYAEAHNNFGLVLAAQGKYEQAINHYHQALSLKQGYSSAHNNLAIALLQMGKVEEAASHFRAAVRLKPDWAEAHSNLGNVLFTQGRFNEAGNQYMEALRIKPNQADIHHNLAVALSRQGKIEEAIEHYTEVVRLLPNSAVAHNDLGFALARRGNLEGAIKEYGKALEIRPDYAEAHNNMGVAFAGLGMLEKAIVHFSEAVRLKPNYGQARHNLELALEEASQPSDESAVRPGSP